MSFLSVVAKYQMKYMMSKALLCVLQPALPEGEGP